MKPKIFLLYPHYYPHYRAGGPVQSLFNLANLLNDQAQVYLVSHYLDIDGSVSDQDIRTNEWITGVNGETIFYTRQITPWLIFRLIREVQPAVVFINGMFNISTTLPGLLASRWFNYRTIISPRGMLQSWGLQRGRLKKLLFLNMLKLLLRKNEEWHATDKQEESDIVKIFGKSQIVYVASNIPRKVSALTLTPFRQEGEKIRLVFLSLINPNKNLHLVIDAVRQNENFTLDVFGPIASQAYWVVCQKKMQGVDRIRYHGAVPPWKISDTLKDYHFFILPTQGENFGHAIFDALSSSVPVLISKFTPWTKIDEKGAGFYVDLSIESIATTLQKILAMEENSYQKFRENAHQYVDDFWKSNDYASIYQFLLSK